jgi:hypothetical protein
MIDAPTVKQCQNLLAKGMLSGDHAAKILRSMSFSLWRIGIACGLI